MRKFHLVIPALRTLHDLFTPGFFASAYSSTLHATETQVPYFCTDVKTDSQNVTEHFHNIDLNIKFLCVVVRASSRPWVLVPTCSTFYNCWPSLC